MMQLTDNEKNLLRTWYLTPQYKVFERLISIMMSEINDRPTLADTEWETIRNCVELEGQKNGLRRLQQEILSHATNVKT